MKSIKPCCQNFKYLNILKEYFKGQYNQYIQEKEQEYKEFIEIGAGFDINDLEQKNFIPIKMMNTNRKGHLFCFGTTGSGKSRLIEVMVEQDIKNGHNVVIIDPKIDNELISRAYQSCVQSDRMNDFMLLSTVYPDISIKINPLANYYMVDEIINHTVASVPAKDPFFYSIAQETTSAIVYSRLIQKKENRDTTPLTFYDIYSYASHAGLTKLETSLKAIKLSPRYVLEDDLE